MMKWNFAESTVLDDKTAYKQAGTLSCSLARSAVAPVLEGVEYYAT